jgi:UDP-glucose 4-epimerase
MKALITGGAGCIGSDLAEALLSRCDEVVVLDNLSSGRLEHIQDLLDRPGFTFLEGDLLDLQAVDSAMKSVEMVFHLAANPDVKFTPGEPTDKDLNQNTIATYNLLEAMRRHSVRKLAFSSTSAVYGMPAEQPIAEDTPFPKPISLYGATKLSCEAMIGAFQHLFGFQVWIFRFANILGPKTRKIGRTVISDFISRLQQNPKQLLILGNGKQAKSYLLSSECVAAMLFVVQNADGPWNVYNLGCDDSLTVDRIAELLVREMGLNGVEFSYTGGEGGWPGDVPRFCLDVTAVNRLGWKAAHTSEQAVVTAIQQSLAAVRWTSGDRAGYPCKP